MVKDELYDEVIKFAKEKDNLTVSDIQRKFKIGYNRAAKMIEKLREDSILKKKEKVDFDKDLFDLIDSLYPDKED